LPQAEIAEALHVTPECIVRWECGQRRMELSKLPRLAAALQIDAKELCAKALSEFHPAVYAALFGNRTRTHDASSASLLDRVRRGPEAIEVAGGRLGKRIELGKQILGVAKRDVQMPRLQRNAVREIGAPPAQRFRLHWNLHAPR
jgi:transcriptional regulator with XRE-family HTH domain